MIGIVAAVLLLGIAAWGALAIFFPPERVEELVSRELSQRLARDVRFESASIGIFPPVRVTVRGLALAEPGGFEAGRALEVRAVHLDFDLFALLARRIVFRQVSVIEPRVHWALRADGSHNLEDLMASETGAAAGAEAPSAERSAAMDLAIHRIRIENAGILFDDLSENRRTVVQVDSDLSLDLTEGGSRLALRGHTVLSDLSFGKVSTTRSADLDRSWAEVEWRIEHDGTYDLVANRLALDRLALEAGGTSLALRGVVDEPGPEARFDLQAEGDGVEIGDLLDLLAVSDVPGLRGISGSGSLSFSLRIRDRLQMDRLPNMTGEVRIDDGRIRYPSAGAEVRAFQMISRFAPDTVDVQRLAGEMRTDAGEDAASFNSRFEMTNLDDPSVRFALEGNLHLGVVAPYVAPRETRMGGMAEVSLRGNGRLERPDRFELGGTVRLRDGRVESDRLERPIEEIEGELLFSRQEAEIRKLTARAGSSSFQLDARVQRPLAAGHDPEGHDGPAVDPAEIRFTFTSPHLDLDELLPPVPTESRSGLPYIRGGGHVSLGRFQRQRLELTDVEADVGVTPTALQVIRFTASGYSGQIEGNATITLEDPQRPVIQMSSQVTDVDAEQLLSTWTPIGGLLQGRLNSDIELLGAGLELETFLPTLTAEGLAKVSSATLGPGPVLRQIAAFTGVEDFGKLQIRDGQIPFDIERGRVRMREVRLTTDNGEWKAAGSIGFDGTLDYAVSTALPASLKDRLGGGAALAAGALQDDQGRILIDLRIGGTAQSPDISWDTEAMQDRLRGRASDALRELGRSLGGGAGPALGDSGAADSLGGLGERARALTDTLKKKGWGELLDGVFGGSGKE